MATEVEIKVRLRLDSNAEAQLAKTKRGFMGAGEAAKKASVAVGGFVKQVAATAIGTHLPRIVGGVADIATEWFRAANAAYDQQQAMAGLLMMSQKLDYKTAREGAEEFHDRLLALSFDIGQNFDEVAGGAKALTAAFGASRTQLNDNLEILEDITAVSNVLGYNVADISGQFAQFALRGELAEGEFFKLLMSTGRLGDDMTKVSGIMSKLAPDKKMMLAVDALKAAASEMKKTEPTFSDLWNSANTALQMLKESVGSPIIKALIPVMEDLKEKFKAAQPELQRMARTLGRDVGAWVKDAAKDIQKGFEYLKTHGHEIKQDLREAAAAIKDAFQAAYKAVQFMIKNKEALAAAYGVSKVAGAGISAGGGPMALGQSISGVKDVGGAVKGALKGGVGSMVGVGAGLAGLAALTAAITAMGLAADQAAKLIDETSGERSQAEQDALAKYEAAQRAFHNGNIARARELAIEVASGSSAHRTYAASLRNEINAAIDANKQLKEQIQGAAGTQSVEGLRQLIGAYNQAVESNNVAMMQFAGKTLIASSFAVENFSTAEMNLTGGIDTLRTAVGEYARSFKDEMDSIKIDLMLSAEKTLKETEAKEKAAEMRNRAEALRRGARGGGGGVTVNIKQINQEFRKADPDRLVVAMKKDMLKRAARRVQSKRASVFGV